MCPEITVNCSTDMSALGTIVKANSISPSDTEFYTGLLDYYDHWNEIDPRLATHYAHLSRAADMIGNDIVNMATYAHMILEWLRPEHIHDSFSVVVAGGMTEAFIVSLRSACDAVAGALCYKACKKPGQVPSDLRGLLKWAEKNKERLEPLVADVLSENFDWFWNLRSIRDHLIHEGAHANIHCDGHQFNLWVHSPRVGWVTREPLLPLLKEKLQKLISFADKSAEAINLLIDFPKDRLRSRTVSGALIPALHELIRVAEEFANPSP